MTYSAQGTRLNRRGLDTRRRFLDAALAQLAAGGPEAASANRIAEEAGFTWGTVQHQFGDADGVWAAVLEHVLTGFRPSFTRSKREPPSLRRRVNLIVDSLWRTLDSVPNRAVRNLQLALPHDREVLARSYPATEAMLRRLDEAWTESWESLFEDVDVSPAKLRRVRSFVPTAVQGLHDRAQLSTFMDVDDARQGLIDAVTAYLE